MPQPPDHLVLAAGSDVRHELEVRRSRFLCTLRRVADEPGARAVVAELRGAHHAARHHCSAFVLGPARELRRSSDDGEPSGTAGTPMLQALLGHVPPGQDDAAPPTDIVAVVVRYFGGTLLGAGGLVRAYAAAVTGALDRASFVRRERRTLRRLILPHGVAGRIEHELHGAGVVVRGTDYAAEGVRLTVAVAGSGAGRERFAVWLAERRLTAEDVGEEWIDVPLGA